MAGDDKPKSGESITLDSLQHDILIPQIQAFLDATNEPGAREVYLALKTAIDATSSGCPRRGNGVRARE